MPPSPESPVVLQVLPSLVTGGVERGTVEITQALVAAEATALVASAGGPMVAHIQRAGGEHLTMPLKTKILSAYGPTLNGWRGSSGTGTYHWCMPGRAGRPGRPGWPAGAPGCPS